jgi:radical SAM-linked protein
VIGFRYAIRFGRDSRVKDLSHRDVIGVWEAALVASGLPLVTTDARSRHPRFAVVAPLPPGYTSDCEWLEAYLSAPRAGEDIVAAVNATLPEGLRALSAEPQADRTPSLQSRLRWAEYRFTFDGRVARLVLQSAISRFFERGSLPWEEVIDGKTKRFDLLATTDDLWLEEGERGAELRARLDASRNGTGRPDSLLGALGLGEPCSKERTALLFSYMPEAIVLWRRTGRFESARPAR